jgi:hypothetical protein
MLAIVKPLLGVPVWQADPKGLTAVFADLTCCKSKVDGVGILVFGASLIRKVRHQCDKMLSAADDSDTRASQSFDEVS